MQLLLSSPLLERRWYEPDIVKQQTPFNISIAHDTHHIPTMVRFTAYTIHSFFWGMLTHNHLRLLTGPCFPWCSLCPSTTGRAALAPPVPFLPWQGVRALAARLETLNLRISPNSKDGFL